MLTRIFSAIKSTLSKREISDRAEIAEDVLYGKASGGDTEAILAVAQLTTALCNNKCAGVVDAGLFIFFKIRNDHGEFQIFHKRLTVRERAILNERPSLLQDPYKILENLDSAVPLEKPRAEELRTLAISDAKKLDR